MNNMKSILRTTTVFTGLFILLNTGFAVKCHATGTDWNQPFDTIVKEIDLGCITKQLVVKTDYRNGLLIRSKRFVFYINRNKSQVLFVSNRLSFSKGDFEYI